jgi:hypothetical protein
LGDEQVADRFVFTNKTIKVGRVVAIGLVALGALSMVLPMHIGWLDPARPPLERVNAVGFFAIGAFLLVVGVVVRRESVVRTWIMDREGVEFHDAWGHQKCLRWHEVERVRWGPHGVRLQSNSERLFLPWGVIPRGQDRCVKRKIAGSLPEFNLPADGKLPVRSFLVDLLITALVMVFPYISIRVTMLLGFALIPMARRLKWDGTIFASVLLVIWMSLTLAILLSGRILAGPKFWYDRQLVATPRTVTPEV